MEPRIPDLCGRRIPRVQLAELRNGEVASLNAADLLGKGHVLVMWMPGAFTPACSGRNVPGLVANAVRLRKSGLDDIVCIAAGDPVAVDAWSKSLDPAGRVRFVSDCNLEFARALGLQGGRAEHHVLTLREGLIETSRTERHSADHAGAGPETHLLDI